MRYKGAFLTLLLLPTAVLLQNVTAEDLSYIQGVFGSPDKPENNETPLSEEDLLRLQKILGGPDTSTTFTTTESSATSDEPDLNLDPDPYADYTPCRTEEGHEGLCVAIYQCDAAGVIDVSTIDDPRDGTCTHYMQKCCLKSKVNETITPTPAPAPTPTPPVAGATQCGWSNPGANNVRVRDMTNSNNNPYADYGEYPWMIAVVTKGMREDDWSQQKYLGGGSLIHPSVVITVAHTVKRYKANKIKCRAGEWDTRTVEEELYPHQDRDVKKIITHEEYYPPAFNDIAMLVLSNPFDLQNAPQIGIACLSAQLPAPRTKCYSMGWGKEFISNKYAVILKKVELPFVPSDTCEAQLRKTRYTDRFRLDISQMCAGGEAGVDTCKGDGGSSLVCPIGDSDAQRFSVYGMVALGVGCGDAIPAIYVNIPQMLSWVDSKMIAEGFGTSGYRA